MKRLVLAAIIIVLTGCGVTRTHVDLADGTSCQSNTYTVGKDISGGKFNGCGATWGVDSSDPNAQMAQGMIQMMNFLVPLAIKGMTVP